MAKLLLLAGWSSQLLVLLQPGAWLLQGRCESLRAQPLPLAARGSWAARLLAARPGPLAAPELQPGADRLSEEVA